MLKVQQRLKRESLKGLEKIKETKEEETNDAEDEVEVEEEASEWGGLSSLLSGFSLAKLREQRWAQPVARALGVTAGGNMLEGRKKTDEVSRAILTCM